MTDKEMIERLEAVALWVSEIADGLPFHSAAEAMATGVESDVDAVLAALRSRPAPPDALVAKLNVRHDEALHTAIGWMSQEENLVTTREALIELLMMLKPVIFAAPAPVAAPAPETPAPDAMPAPFSPPMGVCQWLDDGGDYATECGHGWQFIDGDVTLNDAKFCLFCGGKIQVIGAEAQP